MEHQDIPRAFSHWVFQGAADVPKQALFFGVKTSEIFREVIGAF